MARRPQGWTLQQDKRSGNYIAQFRIAGRIVRRSTRSVDPIEAKRRAQAIYEKALAEAESPPLLSDDPPMAALFECYLATLEGLRAPEYLATQTSRAVLLAERFPHLSHVTDANVRAFHRERLQEVTASTLRRDLVPLSRCLAWAYAEGLIRDRVSVLMPDRLAQGTKANQTKHATLTEPQAERLIAALPERTNRGNPLRDVFTLAWDTGLRAGTIWRLEHPRHFKRGCRHLTLTPDVMKTRDDLAMPLTERAYDILERHSVGKIGVLFERWDYRTAIERTAKELGFGRVHLRSLRHSAITDAAKKGATRAELQALAGHAFATTTDRYLHSDLDDAQRALDKRFGLSTHGSRGNDTPRPGAPTGRFAKFRDSK